MESHLTREGVQVTVAADGREGVDKALESLQAGNAFDLIFMDLDMPVMTGWQAIEELREKGYIGCVIALTADYVSAHRQWSDAGFDDYVVKPIAKPDLWSLINKHVN